MNTPPHLNLIRNDAFEENAASASKEPPAPVEIGGGDSNTPGMDDGWRSSVDRLLGELKGALDGFRHSLTILSGAVALLAAIMLASLGFLNNKIDKIADKVDAIPQVLREEFRAMRAEMAAQTSAIANSITATRQAQPMVVIPPSQTPPTAPKP